MTWSERQKRLLAAIGIRVWAPAPVPSDAEATAGATATAIANANANARPATNAGATMPASAASQPTVESPAVPAATPVRRPTAAPAPVAVPVMAGRPASAPTANPVPAERSPRPPVDERIATLGWTDLQQAVAACTACSLSASRRQTVFGVGNPQAHWMIVGEAPGEREDEAGEPFVGPAGQLLDQMLRAVGLTRGDADPAHQVFIANTLKCRPPRNRNPEAEELARCEPYLRRQIALVRPRLLLAMGRFAVKMLLDSDEAIGKLRGRVHRHEGIPVVVTYHPAYLLRNLADKARAWDDLCLAAATIEAEPPRADAP